MLKKVTTLLAVALLCIVFCTSTYAASKEDIIGYVNSQSVCGDVAMFNSYKSAFTRLLKQKKLTEEQLNTIYSYLQNSVGVLNSKGVCRISDLGKLTKEERNTVYNNLTMGASIITGAPNLSFEEQNTNVDSSDKNNNIIIENNNNQAGTNVTINTQTNTMDIYENGVLVDKVGLSENKMTYTGTNITHVVMIVMSVLVFVIALVCFILLNKTHTAKTRFIKNILVSFMICSLSFGTIILIFGDKIDKINSMLNLITFSSNTNQIKIQLNDDKSIKTYPSYGLNYASLTVPDMGIDSKVYFGDSQDILSLGIGHTTWSDMPTENGVVIYSGHNKSEMLYNLKDVQLQDKIIVDTTYAKCTYKVQKTEVLMDTQTDKLGKIDNKETLILYTCYPFDTYVYTQKRFVVYSTLESIQWK